ncbi:CDP-glycerol glycerophosphotransferase family protein [Thaumasiovibrio sp. DFM-14]|uniref:bifunctional glycosyltransferase/CDP-glycerol:glycerophosphate glycerophosphotransferase n=1 Tax=Thaumasiovibrio sp. DFM-14 TaxID=3384792 RepID=UPI0039A192D2
MGNANSLVSIIIPCYNAEHTIEWTIRSVTTQTYKNVEVICIDDCSTDATYLKLQELATIDSRVKVFKNDRNCGQGETRNNGISFATGTYISFLDADDYFEPNFIERLLYASLENDADISQCAVRYIFNDRNYITGSPDGIISGEHCSYRIDLNDGLPYLTPQVWNKLYKINLFDQVRFKAIFLEDAEIMTYIAKQCNKIVCISSTHYHYNKRFSVQTGNVRRDIERLPYFFNSIIESIKPFVTTEFISLLNKWGSNSPRCSKANTVNFLNTLVSTKDLYSSTDVNKIQEIFEEFVNDLYSQIPESKQREYNQEFDFFRKKMKFKSKNKHKSFLILMFRKIILGSMERSMPFIDRVVSKNDNEWLFTTWARHPSHTVDNPRAIFESVKHDNAIKKVVILNSNKAVEPDLVNNVVFYPLHSLKGMLAMMRAGKIYTGYSLHAIFGYRKLSNIKSRKIIQLWHGIPIKKVGLAVSPGLENHWSLECQRYNFTIANSDDDKVVMERSFFPDSPQMVKLTGLPRHDFLVIKEESLPEDYKKDTLSLRSRLNGKRLFLYAPTWRFKHEMSTFINYQQLVQLDELFRAHNAVLGIRAHSNMMRDDAGNMFISDNVIYLNDYPDVNIVMREVNALITDYSSLYLDFMMQDKPVLLYTPDIDRYKSNRGFNYTATEFIPHSFSIQSFDELFDRIGSVLKDEYTIDEQYRYVKKKFSKFGADGKSAIRVLESMEYCANESNNI